MKQGKQQQEGKSLDDLINEPLPTNPAHRLEVIMLYFIIKFTFKHNVCFVALNHFIIKTLKFKYILIQFTSSKPVFRVFGEYLKVF
jgi:hypothetical protein